MKFHVRTVEHNFFVLGMRSPRDLNRMHVNAGFEFGIGLRPYYDLYQLSSRQHRKIRMLILISRSQVRE